MTHSPFFVSFFWDTGFLFAVIYSNQGTIMKAENRIAIVSGFIWILEKLRIITRGDAENARVRVMFKEALIKREKERESWGL